MILAGVLGYIFGSIPFSYVVPKLMKGIDIRKFGSGNVGTTNVFRACGLPGAILAFLGDIAKGMIAFAIAHHLWSYEAALIAGMLAMIGHCYSFVLGFKGGKGVATSAGIILMSNPLIFALLLVIQASLIALTKIVSLSSILAAIAFPVISLAFNTSDAFVLFSFAMSLFVIFRHHTNIARLLRGEENKFGKKK